MFWHLNHNLKKRVCDSYYKILVKKLIEMVNGQKIYLKMQNKSKRFVIEINDSLISNNFRVWKAPYSTTAIFLEILFYCFNLMHRFHISDSTKFQFTQTVIKTYFLFTLKFFVNFSRIRTFDSANIPCKFDSSTLHTQAYPCFP